jgi:hypothetical protein
LVIECLLKKETSVNALNITVAVTVTPDNRAAVLRGLDLLLSVGAVPAAAVREPEPEPDAAAEKPAEAAPAADPMRDMFKATREFQARRAQPGMKQANTTFGDMQRYLGYSPGTWYDEGSHSADAQRRIGNVVTGAGLSALGLASVPVLQYLFPERFQRKGKAQPTPFLILVTKVPTYRKLLPWYEVAQEVIDQTLPAEFFKALNQCWFGITCRWLCFVAFAGVFIYFYRLTDSHCR